MAGLLGGADCALDVEYLREFKRLAGLRGDSCPKSIADGGEAALRGCRKMTREKKAEWEVVFTCSILARLNQTLQLYLPFRRVDGP
jgi:hypothetical protein